MFAWGACAAVMPVVLIGFFFQPLFIILFAALLGFFHKVVPRIRPKSPLRSPRAALFCAELIMAFLALFAYTADHRASDCRFEPDKRITPLVTYAQCLKMDAMKKEDCLRITGDPYAMALYKRTLLTVSGRNDTTLGRINIDDPADFTAENLGFGNMQQIVFNPSNSHALFPMWKNNRVMVYDLEKKESVAFLTTGVSKLIGAERSGDDVYVLSENPFLYKIALSDYSVKEFPLPYRHNNLYDIIADDRRGALFFSDWVSGLAYRYDMKAMKPDKQRWFPGLVTGLTLDSDKCELFVSHGLPGLIEILDCVSLKTIRSLKVGFGGHEMELSKDGKKIYLVRYFGGDIAEIDRATGRVLYEGHIGSGARDIMYLPEENRVFAASRCGIYELDIK